MTLLIQYIKFKLAKPSLEVLGLKICTFRKWRRLTYKRLLFYWNPKTTGSNTSQWQSLAYTSQTFVKTGTYDVLDAGGHPWQESQPGTFIVTSAQPNNAIITESNSGEVTITPGAVRSTN